MAALLAVSCQRENVPEEKQTNTIHFSNIRKAFAQGTQFGLFAGEPINKTNLKLTVNSQGALVPEDSLYWGQDQKSASSFLCYTPYDKTYTGTSATFKVKENQDVQENATASDLMCAVTAAAPSDASVNFNFAHKMSTAKFYFDNKTNSNITKVELTDVCTSCNFSLTSGEVSSPTDKKTISCYNNEEYWQVVFVPQSIKLIVRVTLENGKQYTKEASAQQTFESGKVYSTDKNPIVIKDFTSKAINMVFSVSDWADGGQLNFNGEDSPFTRLSLYGCYSSTDSESPVAVRTYEKTADQISYSKSSSARDWKLFNMSTGKYLIVNLPTASIASGAEIKASVNTDGTVESRTVTVVKKTSTGAWLEDKTNHIGYVIALQ